MSGSRKAVPDGSSASLKIAKFAFGWHPEPVERLRSPGLGSTIVRITKKQTLFEQGVLADCVFYLLKGRVKLTALSSEGREATIAILQQGDFLGEECLGEKMSRRMTTAVALSDCTVLKTERKAMFELLQRDAQLFQFFLSFLLSRNARMQDDLIDRLFHNSAQRLARVLLLLAGLDRSSAAEVAIPKVSQEVLAEIVGTTRSRVSIFMNSFRKQGLIDYDAEYSGQLLVRRSLEDLLLNPQ
jgi:CRP-like cAMP-binding protein